MVILIPCYKPDEKLLSLLDGISEKMPETKTVIVDDGSGADYGDVFEKASEKNADVIGYAVNRGKGGALKEGFRHIAADYPGEDVVTADCDGQHSPDDICKVGKAIGKSKSLVLGCRNISEMPPRSKSGNTLTKILFWILTGKVLTETQTGLRGVSSDLVPPYSGIKGNRYEYEMNMLFDAVDNRTEISEVPISTIYIENNRASHFKALKDGLKIYRHMFANRLGDITGFAAFLVLASLLFGVFIKEPGTVAVAITAISCYSLRFVVMQLTSLGVAGSMKDYRLCEVIFGFAAAVISVCIFALFFFKIGFGAVASLFITLIVDLAVRILLREIKRRMK